jgi:hypothetical protein
VEEERVGEADASTITTVMMWEVDTVACRLVVTSRWSGRSLSLLPLRRLCQDLDSACLARDKLFNYRVCERCRMKGLSAGEQWDPIVLELS